MTDQPTPPQTPDIPPDDAPVQPIPAATAEEVLATSASRAEVQRRAAAIIKHAEEQIRALLAEGERDAAQRVSSSRSPYGTRRAEGIARDIIEGKRAQARELAATMRAVINQPTPDIHFSERLTEAESDAHSSDAEKGALQFEGALDAILNPVLQSFERALNEGGPKSVADPDDHAAHEPHIVPDTVTLAGATFSVPGGIYTVVFGALAVLTILEVVIAEIFPDVLATPLLVGMSLAKAVLVVLFYMHLRNDSRFFAWSLLLPLGMALLITFFLMLVPTNAYQ